MYIATHCQQYTVADVAKQNVLKVDMEVVVCDVEQCILEKVMDVIYVA